MRVAQPALTPWPTVAGCSTPPARGVPGDERVVVKARDVVASESGDLAIGHATLTYTAISAEGRELRSLDNRCTLALRRAGGTWKIFHEHTSGPIDHKTMKGMIKR